MKMGLVVNKGKRSIYYRQVGILLLLLQELTTLNLAQLNKYLVPQGSILRALLYTLMIWKKSCKSVREYYHYYVSLHKLDLFTVMLCFTSKSAFSASFIVQSPMEFRKNSLSQV